MEDRGQVLDLAAAGAELALAAAVGADPALLAVVVGGEEVGDRAEPRGLDVDRPRRRPRHRLDVGDRVDRRVPGHPLRDRIQDRPRLVVDVRVLEPGVGEGLDQLRVEHRVGDDVDRGAFVEALEVERVDRAGLDQRRDQLVVPVVEGVELEAQGRVDLEPFSTGSIEDFSSGRKPFLSNVTISITTESETIIDVNMIDVSGKVLKTITQSVPRGISQISLKDLDQLPAGVYLMEIADKRAGTTYQKLLKNSK